MSIIKAVSGVFNLLGAFLCLLAIIAGGVFVTALVERTQHGLGIMFADVEFVGLTALALFVSGLSLLMVGSCLKRGGSRSKSKDVV